MPVDDLWFLSKRGPDGERVKSGRHGRGNRWRVRYTDANGDPATRSFDRKADADAWDAQARTGVVVDSRVDRSERRVTFRDYAERWRLSRESGWAVLTRRRIESNLRCQIYPVFGDRPFRSITLTSVLEWVTSCIAARMPESTLKLYIELFDTVATAAVIDKVIPDNPCDGVKLSKILRGYSRTPKWVPDNDQVNALIKVVPARYRAMIYLGACQGERLGEALGTEAGTRCVDSAAGELHVVQQLQYAPSVYDGGFFLTAPKAGSSGTIDLDPVVDHQLAEHMRLYPPVEVDLIDVTSGRPVPRLVPLVFTTSRGNPFTDRTWSREWAKWRDAAGWPTEHGTFHALRHFFATTLITNHAEPKEVQWLLRHKTLRITLETYVGWWPKRERKRGMVGGILGGGHAQDQS